MSVNTADSEPSETMRSPEADLALIKEMMMAGRQRMGVDGVYLMIWGCLLSLAFLAQYLSIIGTLPKMMFGIWVPTYVIGLLTTYIIRRRSPRVDAENNIALRVYATSWNVTGAGIGLYFVSSVLSGHFDHMTITFLTTALIGASFMLTALVTGLKKLRLVAFGWWGLIVFFAVFGDIGPQTTLILSAASVLLIFIPGFFLRRMMGSEG